MVTAAFGSAHILFLSTPSARRATWYNYINKATRPIISIHALREEGDGTLRFKGSSADGFLSTPSARRATRRSTTPCSPQAKFYPRPPRGGRRSSSAARPASWTISIHALREEGDSVLLAELGEVNISIHALREEGDRREPDVGGHHAISIHALREEGDLQTRRQVQHLRDFYPRPPRGGRQQKQRQNLYFQTNYTTFCTNLEEP